jgi:hypothetical protein
MSHTTFDKQFEQLESQLQALTDSLVGGDPHVLQDASNKFQQLTVELLQMVKDAQRTKRGLPDGFRRISALSSGMATFRENLFRRRAYIDCALGVLIPTTGEKSTYAGSRVYGGPIARSGGFTAFSA